MKVIGTHAGKSEHDSGFSVRIQSGDIKVWVDVGIIDHDVRADWNMYIFHLNNPDDVAIKEFQEDSENFCEATSLAVWHLQKEGHIYQDDKGAWYYEHKQEEDYPHYIN